MAEQVSGPSASPPPRMFLRPIHVVHIDDSDVTQVQVEAVLLQSTYPQFVLHSFPGLVEAQQWMGGSLRDQLDCVLLDLQLAQSLGMDTFQQAVALFKSVPIVVLSATFDVDLACQLIYQGAECCLSKNVIGSGNLAFHITQAVARKSRPVVPPTQMRDAVAALLATHDRARLTAGKDHSD